jgi:hypothetical protein
MYTTHSEIIEYHISTFDIERDESLFYIREAYAEIFLSYIRRYRGEVFFRTGEILAVTIESYEHSIFHGSTEESRMASETECGVEYHSGRW